jgi:hypothetical protein
MPYATDLMGVGSYVGEVEEGPDGQLYEWVEGVDGLGNPLGFWKGLKRAAGGLIKKALPVAARFARFTPWGAAAGLVAPRLFRFAQRQFAPQRRPLQPYRRYPQYPQYQPAPAPMPPPPPMAMAPPPAMPMAPTAMPESAEAPQPTGTEGFGAIAEGPDGQLYEVVDGIGEFGERRRLFRRLRRFKRRERREDEQQEQQQQEQQQRMRQRFQNLRGRFQQFKENIRERLAEGPDGQLYEYVEGIGAMGESRPHWRPVRLCFPATIGSRRGRGRSYRRPTTTSSSSSSSSALSPYRRY